MPALVSTAMIGVNSSYISTDVVGVKSELGFLGLKGNSWDCVLVGGVGGSWVGSWRWWWSMMRVGWMEVWAMRLIMETMLPQVA